MQRPDQKQKGAILLLLLLVFFISGSTLLLGALNNRQDVQMEQDAEVLYQMQLAKEALLAYAAGVDSNFNAGPGHLPCPDIDHDSEGISDADCDPDLNKKEYIGRLPRYVLNESTGERFYLSETYADIDQQFWYAVSPAYLQTSVGGLKANSTTAGDLSVDMDGAMMSNIVAVIIAPGEPIADQDREASPKNYASYLEGGNGINTEFTTSYPANPTAFNDKVLTISRQEIMTVATMVVAKRIKTELQDYRTTVCSSFPRANRNVNTCNTNSSTAADNFRTMMNNSDAPDWINSTTVSGWQNWIGNGVATYTYSSTNRATVSFAGCGITYTFIHTTSTNLTRITKSQLKC